MASSRLVSPLALRGWEVGSCSSMIRMRGPEPMEEAHLVLLFAALRLHRGPGPLLDTLSEVGGPPEGTLFPRDL